MTTYNPHPVADLRTRISEALSQARERMKTHEPSHELYIQEGCKMKYEKFVDKCISDAEDLIQDVEDVADALLSYQERRIGLSTVKKYCELLVLLESYAQKDDHFFHLKVVCADFLDIRSNMVLFLEDFITKYDAVDKFKNKIASMFSVSKVARAVVGESSITKEALADTKAGLERIDDNDPMRPIVRNGMMAMEELARSHPVEFEAFCVESMALQNKYMNLFASLFASSSSSSSKQ